MPAQPRKPAAPKTVDVGGVTVSTDEIRSAIDTLTASAGIMIKQPLAKAGHALAVCDYHRVVAEQRTIDTTGKLSSKPTFVQALERLAAE